MSRSGSTRPKIWQFLLRFLQQNEQKTSDSWWIFEWFGQQLFCWSPAFNRLFWSENLLEFHGLKGHIYMGLSYRFSFKLFLGCILFCPKRWKTIYLKFSTILVNVTVPAFWGSLKTISGMQIVPEISRRQKPLLKPAEYSQLPAIEYDLLMI